MKIVKGINQAKPLLARQLSFQPSTPPWMEEDIRAIFGEALSLEEAVARIIADVRQLGDEAVYEYTRKIDGIELASLEVSRKEIEAAYEEIDERLVLSLKRAEARLRSFHLTFKPSVGTYFTENEVGQKIYPLDSVGIYAPGGTASYPSTVLMAAIPARIAGVREIVLTSPPRRGGSISPLTLVAANISGIDRIFKIGGAQAIAALAFGTESVPKVGKICGPGNIFVVLAKKAVYGVVGIDGLQGPSEILIVADATANPPFCAADLLAQAEHDPLATAMLVTTSAELAEEVIKEVERQLEGLERKAIIAKSLENNGMIILVDNIDEAVELANFYSPEHLCLMVQDANSYIEKITNAGCIFIGDSSSVVMGDYVAGPSHILPTGGTARFQSPLGVSDFLKITNLVAFGEVTLQKLASNAITIAKAEGLDAHARAIEIRLKKRGLSND